jgi:hypothetical protein
MRRLLSIALAVALLTVACSSTSAEDAYCDSLQALFDSVFAAQSLTPASTVEEAQEAADAVISASDDAVAAAGDQSEAASQMWEINALDAQISEIESAREGFDDAISEIPDSGTLGDAQLALQNALEGYFEAVGPAIDAQCPAAE